MSAATAMIMMAADTGAVLTTIAVILVWIVGDLAPPPPSEPVFQVAD